MRTANLDKRGLGLFHISTPPAWLVEINMNHQDAKPPKDPLVCRVRSSPIKSSSCGHLFAAPVGAEDSSPGRKKV
jgi:hypothetical protein